jgi:putative transposase
MARKHFSAEQIISTLRQIEVETGKGTEIEQACRSAGITNQSYYRWKRMYGGLKLTQAKRFKELEKENLRLKRIVADLTVDNQILKEYNDGLNQGKF